MAPRSSFDPYRNDPLRWGASMAHHAGLMLACLDVVAPERLLEIGAYAGDLTRVLADWADGHDATLTAIDPAPQPGLVALAAEHARVELVRETSLAALPGLDADAIVIDGDHNYWTVAQELRLIGERLDAGGPGPGPGLGPRRLPLLLCHDVGWPHGRRDDYFDVERIPAEHRRLPLVGDGAGITPGDPGSPHDGLPYPRSAAREGGPGNGVLTAVEDFVAQRPGLRLAVVPAFFGLGVVWDEQAPWAPALAAILDGWDGHPLVAALEANRVLHLAGEHALRIEIWDLRERLNRQETVLRRLLDSRAFEVAEALSRLRVRAGIAPGQSIISRRQVRRALRETGATR